MALELMSWVKAQKRWIKKLPVDLVERNDGKRMVSVSAKQLGCRVDDDGAASRDAANEWWKAKEKELLENPVADAAINELTAMASWHSAQGNQVEAAQLRGRAADLATMAPSEVARIDQPSRYLPQAAKAVWSDRLGRAAKPVAGLTVGAAWAKWFDSQKLACEAGQFTVSRLESYRSASERFADWLGRGNPITVLDSPRLWDYREYLLGLVTAEAVVRTKSAMGRKSKLSGTTADGYLACAKQLTMFLAEREIIELPKALLSKKLRIKKAVVVVKPVPLPIVKKLLAGCLTEKTKLYLLLMLNCGMYQTDVAELKESQVNWKAGTITRPRSKVPGGPVVTHYLWPQTFALLKEHRSGGPVVLLNENNEAMLRDGFKQNYKKNDAITSALKRLKTRLVKECGTEWLPKQLRKTSATMLGQHKDYKFYAQYFLAQSPRTVADKHYMVPSEVEFAQACKWLGEQYGL